MNLHIPPQFVKVDTVRAEALLEGTGWQRVAFSDGERICVPHKGAFWHVAAHTLGGEYYFSPEFLSEAQPDNPDTP